MTVESRPYAVHPAADAFPLLGGAEYATLRDDIAAHGLRMPVVLTPDGQLLDGRNRLRACEELGVDPATVVYEGEPVAFVVSLNIARRHLNENQRGMVARKLANMRHGGDRTSEESKRSIDLLLPEISITQAATMLNVSPSTVKRAMAVGKAAEAGLIPEQRVKDIEQGKATLGKVMKEIKQATEQAKVAEVTTQPVEDRFTLMCAPIATLTLDALVDAIVTDPPYPREYLPVYADLAHFARRSLTPGGSLFVMVGQSYLPDILAMMTPIIPYHWTLAYLTPGGQATQLWTRNVNTFWKPILWFVHGTYTGGWHGDVCQSAPNDNDKRFHHWGQSVSGMCALLEKHTQAGDTICDPFCGGGSTGVAALATGRYFIGSDQDETSIITTRERLRGIP